MTSISHSGAEEPGNEARNKAGEDASVSFPIQFGNVSSPCFLLGEGLWLCEELQTLLQCDGTRMGGTGRGILPAVLWEERRESREEGQGKQKTKDRGVYRHRKRIAEWEWKREGEVQEGN